MALLEPQAMGKGVESNQIIPLNKGIDTSTSKIFSQPGSLHEAMNYEIVDGFIEETVGMFPMGLELNKAPESFFYGYGDVTSTTSTGAMVAREVIDWRKDSGTPNEDIAGQGIIAYISSTVLVIYAVTGESPVDYPYFSTPSGSRNYDIHPTEGVKTMADAGILNNDVVSYLELCINASNSSTVWDNFRPNPLGIWGISSVFQNNDKTYAVRDYPKVAFFQGLEEPSIGDEILCGSETALMGRVELDGGSWEAGDAWGWMSLYPASGLTNDPDDLLSNYERGNSLVITNNTTTNQLGETNALSSPDSSVDVVGAGWLWELDTHDGPVNTGWKFVDMGYSVSFDGGLVAPIATRRPIFVTDGLDSVQTTGAGALTSPATEYPATGTYSAWTGLANLAADDAANARSIPALLDYTRVIELTTTADLIPGVSTILGIQVNFEASQTVGTDVQIAKVQLRNDATGAVQHLSDNKGDWSTLTTTPTAYLFGGQLDKWGFDSIPQADINASDLTVLIQFYNPNGAGTRTIDVDYVEIIVHYAQSAQDVYFYDGSSDVDTGDMYAYQVMDGDWSSDDATGWMTVHNMTAPSDITAGVQIRTGAAGTGDLVAYVKAVEKNILPSYAETSEAENYCQSIESSFNNVPGSKEAYVVNGVGPCYSVDVDGIFQFIRTPVDADKDKPRYISTQRNHLVLGLEEHVIIASINGPNVFSTYDGATTWDIGDLITGLVSTSGGTNTILGAKSVQILQGSAASGEDQFRIAHVTGRTGCKPYSASNIVGATYVDDVGMSTVDISDKFGGFEAGRYNQAIRRWLRPRLTSRSLNTGADRSLVMCIPFRNKNQYRMYFKDGYNLVVTLGEGETPPAYTKQHYDIYHVQNTDEFSYQTNGLVPTGASTSVTSWGEERVIIGTKRGNVLLMDQPGVVWWDANDVGTITFRSVEAWIELNPLPEFNDGRAVRWTGFTTYVERGGYKRFRYSTAEGYDETTPSATNTNALIGGANEVYRDTPFTDHFEVYLGELTEALSIRLETQIRDLYPHALRLVGLKPNYSYKGDKNSAQQVRVL